LNFLPGFLRPCRAIHMAELEAANLEMKETMMAGIAWPIAIVNMTDPIVMEWVLENHDDYFSGSPGFFNGVTAAVVMRFDTTPDGPLIPNFMNHKASTAYPRIFGVWDFKFRETASKETDSRCHCMESYSPLYATFILSQTP